MVKRKVLSVLIAAAMLLECSSALPVQIRNDEAQIIPLTTAAPAATPIYQDESYSYEERAADLVARMTLAEKASQTAGYNASAIPRLGISSYMWWNESLHGYSQEGWFGITQDGASYPSSYSMGASWNPDLYYREAEEIGAEIRERVKGNKYNLTMFSPTVNLARDPRWGRNDESYGEDPLLVGKMGASFVKGVEGKNEDGSYKYVNDNGEGIKQAVTTIKHYAANNSEKNRYTSGADNVTEREMREYYTRPSRIVVDDADVSSVMMAYSSVDGIPISYSSFYMDTLLRQTYGFSGYIVSDCDSIATSYNRNIHKTNPLTGEPYTLGEAYAAAMAHGLDLQCNAGETDGLGSYASNYKKMLQGEDGSPVLTDKGFFTEQQLEVSVHRLMTKRMQLGEFDAENNYVTEGRDRLEAGTNGAYVNGAVGQTQERIELADELSRETIVLLKNEDEALPITAEEINKDADSFKVGIIGPVGQSNFRGGYSSRLSNEKNLVTIVQAIKTAFANTYDEATSKKVDIAYHYGFNSAVNRSSFTGLKSENIDLNDVEDNLDLAIVVVGQGSGDSREDGDRTDLNLAQAQVDLIKQVKAKNPKKLILVMETYGPVQMVDDIVDNADAILWSSFNGFRKGTGFGEAITGKNNPSGRLNATWLKDMINDIPGFFDYRLYPTNNEGGHTYMYNMEETIYPFGYGLSYSDIDYSAADGKESILGAAAADALKIDSITKDSTIDVTVKLTNTNNTAGKQVVEVYAVSPGAGTDPTIPLKRLVGFDKVDVAANGSTTVTIPVAITDLAFFNEEADCYELPEGEWKIWVARSSEFGEGDLSESFTVVNGEIREDPEVVTVKPTQANDDPAVNGVSERVIFDLSADEEQNIIDPNVAVTMTNEKLYGTRVVNNVPGEDIGVDPEEVEEYTQATETKWTVPDSAGNVDRIDTGKGADELPKIGEKYILSDEYTVTYASNRPEVVQVGDEEEEDKFAAGPIVMKAPGVATITVKVTAPLSGEEATTDFVVYVQGDVGLSGITVGGESIPSFDARNLHYNCEVPADMSADDDALVVKATPIDGATVEYSTTDDGSGTIGYAPDETGEGVKPDQLPGSVYIKVSGDDIAEQVYIVKFEEQFSPTSFIEGEIDDKWTVVNEDESLYEAVKGYGLKLPTLPNNISSSNDNWKNLFLRPGAGDWTIITKLYFPARPNQSSQQVQLLAWQDAANYIRVALQPSGGWWGPPTGIAMSMAPTIGGASNGSISCSTNISMSDNDPLVVYYKLQREGLKFTAWYSLDGIEFTRVQSADGRRSSESSLLHDVQVGLFATGNPEIETYCEFIDMTSNNGEVLKTDQEVLNDAFEAVINYLPDVIPEEVSQTIKLPIPYDYAVRFEADDYINEDGTLNQPLQDEKVNVKIVVSHPIAEIDGENEVVVYDGPITVKAGEGGDPDPSHDYDVSVTDLKIEKGKTATFDVTMGSEAVKADIEIADEEIASVDPASIEKDGTVTVSALSEGETEITVTWYDGGDVLLGSKTISVAVADQSVPKPDYDVSTDNLKIKKGDTATFDVTMNPEVVMSAAIAVKDKDIAEVDLETIAEGKTITVSALNKGKTEIEVTWYGMPNNAFLDSKTIAVEVTEDSEPSKPSKGGSSTKHDDDKERWDNVKDKIAGAADGDSISATLEDGKMVPATVIDELKGKNVNLVITVKDKELILNGTNLKGYNAAAVYYTADEIIAMAAPASELPVEGETGTTNANPETGGEVPTAAPAAPEAVIPAETAVPEAPVVIEPEAHVTPVVPAAPDAPVISATPPEVPTEQAEPEPANRNGMLVWLIAAIGVAVAGGAACVVFRKMQKCKK